MKPPIPVGTAAFWPVVAASFTNASMALPLRYEHNKTLYYRMEYVYGCNLVILWFSGACIVEEIGYPCLSPWCN